MKALLRLLMRVRGLLIGRQALWAGVTALAAVSIFYLVQPAVFRYVAGAQARVTPFTLHEETYSFDSQHPDGWLAGKNTIARRSDGATVNVFVGIAQDGSVQVRARDVQLPDGRNLLVFDDVSSVVRTPAPPAWIVAARKEAIFNPPSNCVSPGGTLMGYDEVHGYKVAIVKRPPLDVKRATAWKAPELGCQTLRAQAEAPGPNGTFTPTAETRLVSITPGEPDPSLFEVPTSYAKVIPSQGFRKEFAYLGRPWTKHDDAVVNIYDKGYMRYVRGEFGPAPKNPGRQMYRPGGQGLQPKH